MLKYTKDPIKLCNYFNSNNIISEAITKFNNYSAKCMNSFKKPDGWYRKISAVINGDKWNCLISYYGDQYSYAIEPYLIYKTDEGIGFLTFQYRNDGTAELNDFTPHCVKRYRERDGLDLNDEETIEDIVKTLRIGYCQVGNGIVISFHNYGVFFGTDLAEGLLIRYNTYINEADMFTDQYEIYNRVRETLFQNTFENYLNGKFYELTPASENLFKSFVKRSGIYMENGLRQSDKIWKKILNGEDVLGVSDYKINKELIKELINYE